MLLWLMNLDFAGGEVAFFVSGAIPIEAVTADIIAQYEASIIAPYDPSIPVEANAKVNT